jgi:AraC-like DNA-binding protein
MQSSRISKAKVPYTDIVSKYTDTPHRKLLDLRPDGLAEFPVFGRISYPKARLDLPVHRHFGGMEVRFRDRGYQVFQVANETHRIQGGDMFITFPGEVHSTGGHPVEPGTMYWFLLKIPEKGQRMLGLPAKESAMVIDNLLNLPCRRFRATPKTKSLFIEILRLHYSHQAPLRTFSMRIAMTSLLLEIIHGATQHIQAQSPLRMQDIVRMIQQHPDQEYQLHDLARKSHLSLSRFRSLFKEEMGISPWLFILKTKIDAAKQRLSQGTEPVTQIAMQLGFSSSQYFATVFKRITGVTPFTYRQGAVPQGPSTRHDDGQDEEGP